MNAALTIRDLVKSYGGVRAVDRLSLAIEPGQIYALLGPNGAGKTTTLRIVAGLLAPDAGSVMIAGLDCLADPVAAKRITAWLPDEPMVYDALNVEEYLAFMAGLWQVERSTAEKRAEDLLTLLDLYEVRRQRMGGFSRGMKQKAALAGALIHDPKLLILDEPLTGLDAGAARQVKRLLGERARQGCTVVMTTHILDVAERMADRIGIIARGSLRAEGSFAELRQQSGSAGTLEDVFLALTEAAQ
ncbi:MAG TPA: ABC transporter ATP-binding protein [Magnetospirillaceae bacterium]|nr:ABC transporter ATP-binding protein [Magnetospirillaceae bacterium]